MKPELTMFIRLYLAIAIFLTSLAAAPYSQLNIPHSTATQDLLDDLGGVPCFDGSLFTCVTIEMPLDHFNPADTRTIPITFAVLPASGARKGMFVTATGGPGYSGIASADLYTEAFDPSIPEVFDIVSSISAVC